jgi:hypothetical protein
VKPDTAKIKAVNNFKVPENPTIFEYRTLFTYHLVYMNIYPAMTAFTDQYSLPNIFFDIGQL